MFSYRKCSSTKFSLEKPLNLSFFIISLEGGENSDGIHFAVGLLNNIFSIFEFLVTCITLRFIEGDELF